MTHCYNCGHAGTFVLLVECALAVPGPLSDRQSSDPRGGDSHVGSSRVGNRRAGNSRVGNSRAGNPHAGDSRPEDRTADRGSCAVDPAQSPRSRRPGDRRRGPPGSRRRGDDRSERDPSSGRGLSPERDAFPGEDLFPGRDGPSGDDLSFAVQCPVCASTDVGVSAAELLARYASSTTS